MIIDKSLIDPFVKTTARGAFGASIHRGKNDKIAADKAAVDEMRKELNKINIKGESMPVQFNEENLVQNEWYIIFLVADQLQ